MTTIEGNSNLYMTQDNTYNIKSIDELKIFQELKKEIINLNDEAIFGMIQSKLPKEDAPFLYINKVSQNYQFIESSKLNDKRIDSLVFELKTDNSKVKLITYKTEGSYIPTREIHQIGRNYSIR